MNLVLTFTVSHLKAQSVNVEQTKRVPQCKRNLGIAGADWHMNNFNIKSS